MSDRKNKVTSIVLNYSKPDGTINLYRQLLKQNYRMHEILIVDNCSNENYYQDLSNCIPITSILRTDFNGGFAYGMNHGINYAIQNHDCEYIWLLNNDLELRSPDILTRLVGEMGACTKTGIVSPLIKDPVSNEINFAGGYLSTDGWAHRTTDLKTYLTWQCEHPDRIWLAGTALFVNRKAIELVGGMAEKYYMYWEDNDYCYQINKAGFYCQLLPTVEVYHHDPPWQKRPPYYHYYNARNEIIFMRDCGLAGWRSIVWAIERRLRENITTLLEANCFDAVEATYQGLCDGLAGRTGIRPKANSLTLLVDKTILSMVRRFFSLRRSLSNK